MKSVSLLVFTLFLCKAYCQNGCGDSSWIPYKDQKCFKLLSPEMTVNRATADQLCSKERTPKQDISETYLPTLAEILDADEQELIENYIFGNFTVYNNVWIRAQRGSENTFYWSQGRPMQFAHWEPTSPTTQPERGCVVLTSGYTRMDDLNQENVDEIKYDMAADAGLWRDVNCQLSASVVCQKYQTWSVPKIQTTLMEIRTNLEFEINNKIPVGFIYVQIPGQKPPQELWPKFKWTDISETYAGLFFRVNGGGSADFGVTQEDSCPRLQSVHTQPTITPPGDITIPTDGTPSAPIYGGGDAIAAAPYGMSFTVTAGEVRPRNTATRVWIREA